MSKRQFTPLEALKELRQNNKDGTHLFDDELLDIIEKELSRQEALRIVEEFPLLKLEKLDDNKVAVEGTDMCIVYNVGQYEKEQKKLKAFENIKQIFEIKVSKNKLGQCFISGKHSLFAISQEMYDLLKEGLK